MTRAPRRPGTTDSERLRRVLLWMSRAFLVWLALYLARQGEDGYFARTAERVEAEWVRWVFLNIPLQAVLSLGVLVCASLGRPASLRLGLVLALLDSVLILTHMGLSIATA